MPTTYGLTQAHQLATANGVNPYTPKQFLGDNQWWGNQAQAPAKTDWSAPSYQNFQFQKLGYDTPAPAYQTYDAKAPTYKGFNNGDYDRYELSVRTPGEQAANRAYAQAKTDLADAFSARGMYGSSQYTQQMTNNVAGRYMDTMTANAADSAAKRYDFQKQDMQFASEQDMRAWLSRMQENQAANQQRFQGWQTDYGNKLSENNLLNQLAYQNNANANQFAYRASTDQRDWNDQQANKQITFANALAQDKQNWDLQRLNWDTSQNDATWNRIMTTWGNYDPERERYEKKKLRAEIEQAEQNAQGGGLLSIGKTVLSGLGTIAGFALPTSMGGGSVGGKLIGAALDFTK